MTPTLSEDADQARLTLFAVTPVVCRLGGADGAWLSGPPVPTPETLSLSTLGPPLVPVAVARITLAPDFSVTGIVASVHVSQLAVGAKGTPVAATVPLTVMSMGRSAPVPLA
ncbi:MAG: hypothetical protein AUI10_04995 [Actinobacteria bacterium 13_2_20CM_2_72_6]|nr:MAG: hypothetical protein AUI10_04995 [Actinobacteria bacterium 13_2_20CM_2_72_6]